MGDDRPRSRHDPAGCSQEVRAAVVTTPKHVEVLAAAEVLRTLLAKAASGEVEASSRRDRAAVARLEGALLGLDVASGVVVRGP